MSSTIELIRDYLLTCPYLRVAYNTATANLYVDYISETSQSYEIKVMPGEPYAYKYITGGGMRQTKFLLRSLDIFEGRDIENNTSNIAFFEVLQDWFEENPPTAQGWMKAEALTGGYLMEQTPGQDRGIYQMQCRVLYTYFPPIKRKDD